MIQSIYKKFHDINGQWKPGTHLIIGDSLIYGIQEPKLKNTKVRIFPGSSIDESS